MNEIVNNPKQEAKHRFYIDPDYRQNPYKKDSRDYHAYLNEINNLELVENAQIADYGVQ